MNQDIIAFNNKFETYYDTLVKVLDIDDMEKFSKILWKLSEEIRGNKQKVDELIENLKIFRDKLTTDTNSFKRYSTTITSIMASEDAGIPILQKQLDTHLGLIETYNNMVISGSAAVGFGPISNVGGNYYLDWSKN
nr:MULTISPECIES: HBL/NHE enterotoxin family protein [Bacillus cereus group]